jgi:hypothetical protein
MTDRRPLVNVSGSLNEIPTGDTVPLAAGGTGASTPEGARAALGVVVSLPFYKSAGTLDTIALTSDAKLPFIKTNGSASNIPLTLA